MSAPASPCDPARALALARTGRLALGGLLAMVLATIVAGGCARVGHAPADAWEATRLSTDADFRDIWFADDRHGWMVGGGFDIEGGLIGRTGDGGRTWRYESGLAGPGSATARNGFTAVQFFDSLSGCVIAGGGQVFLTSDGGEHWRLVRSGGGEGFSDVCFVDRDCGWIVGGTGVLRTTDGGEHWGRLLRSSYENGYLSGEAVHFLNRRLGFMTGLRAVHRTEDGGETWVPLPLPFGPGENPHLRDVCFTDPTHGWVVGEEGTILSTTDGGWHWVRRSNGVPQAGQRAPQIVRREHGVDTIDVEGPAPGLHLTAVRFLDASHGWTVGFFPAEGRSVVLRTEDGGANWSEVAGVGGEELRALFIAGDGHGWTVGDRVREGAQSLLRRTPPAGVSAVGTN